MEDIELEFQRLGEQRLLESGRMTSPVRRGTSVRLGTVVDFHYETVLG